MAFSYKDSFPVAFSADGPEHHLYLDAEEYEELSNKAGRKYNDADSKRIDQVIDDLRKIRVAQNSTGGEIRIYGRSLRTGKALWKTIHPRIRKHHFVEVIGLSDHKQNWSNYPWPRVLISKNGVMSPDDRKLMYSDLDNKVLVMMSGGEGRSDQPFYRPIAKFMQHLLDKHIYLWAVCMSYQVMADQVLCLGLKRGQKVPPPQEGRFHIGTQIADITDQGEQDPVFSELTPAFGVESFNHYRIYGSDIDSNKPSKQVKVLARDRATNEVVAFKVGETCWAVQYHPELKKMGRQGKGLQKRRSLSIQGKGVIVPKGIHSYQPSLVNRIARDKEVMQKYHMTPDDMQQFFHPVRRVQNVGDEITLGILEQAIQSKKLELNLE